MALNNGRQIGRIPRLWRPLLAAGLLLACSVRALPGAVHFTEVTRRAGIAFRHNNGAFGRKYLPETMGAGCLFFDADGDGSLDILLINGSNWPGRKGRRTPPALYHNEGNGTFREVTRQSGLDIDFYGMGGAAADYDNDGDEDLYLSGLGPDRLFENQGRGHFRDVTSQAGLGNPGFGTSAAWFDYDRDGRLDLLVANYVPWSIQTDIRCSLDGIHKSYCTPESYPGDSPRLYRNLGRGRFEDVTRSSGVYDQGNKGLGVLIFDYNQDGWPDILLANDTEPNRLWENDGHGRFREVGTIAGIAFSEDGVARGAMGLDAADYDHSGHPSVVIGNFSNQMVALYHNEGSGFFIDDAPASGIGQASLLTLAFGCFFFDYDLDGQPDIYLANGHVEDQIQKVQQKVTYAQPSQLFHNLGKGRFRDVASLAGSDFAAHRVARGAAYGDYDNDGDLDLLVTTNGGPAHLFRNDGGDNHWLTLQLEGDRSNRDGIGTRVRLKGAGAVQTATVHTGSSYCSQSQLRLTFGLGQARGPLEIELTWPSGIRQVLRGVSPDQILRVREKE